VAFTVNTQLSAVHAVIDPSISHSVNHDHLTTVWRSSLARLVAYKHRCNKLDWWGWGSWSHDIYWSNGHAGFHFNNEQWSWLVQ